MNKNLILRWALGFLAVGGIIYIVFPEIGYFLVTVGVVALAIWVGTLFFGR